MVVMACNGLLSIISALMMLFFFYGYYALVEGRNFSRDDCLQMKAYMKLMNKPAVMSIETEYGDIYDCVDIYRQPAFDHPLLKNHALQMEPSFYPNGRGRNYSSQSGLKGGGCPNGTVPIQRIREKDFLHSDPHLRFAKKTDAYIHHYATIGTPTNGEYYGARAFVNVWNPKLPNVNGHSLSQLWMTAGPSSVLNTIEVGWVVSPGLYGDSRTRLFAYWTADGYAKTGCYNIKCPGFIQLDSNTPIDGPLDQVSTYKGQQYDIKIEVFKDRKTGNWFLLKDDILIGYWPSTLFNHLNTKAEIVEWGGEVAQCAYCLLPQMGSGYFPTSGYGEASYIRGLEVTDNTNLVFKDMTNGIVFESKPSCYRIIYNQTGVGPLTGSHIIYGGSGGTC